MLKYLDHTKPIFHNAPQIRTQLKRLNGCFPFPKSSKFAVDFFYSAAAAAPGNTVDTDVVDTVTTAPFLQEQSLANANQ